MHYRSFRLPQAPYLKLFHEIYIFSFQEEIYFFVFQHLLVNYTTRKQNFTSLQCCVICVENLDSFQEIDSVLI